MKTEFVSFNLVGVAIRSFSDNLHGSTPANKKDLMLKRLPMGKPIITIIAKLFTLSILSLVTDNNPS